MRQSPLVTVVLPVYNCPKYIGQAIESILNQTFEDYEFLVIDDGSTDETPAVIKQYADPRLRVISQANVGLPETLNRGIRLAQGQLIARMDQDDVSFPERFARQVALLTNDSGCALVGTWAEIWADETKTERVHAHPSENAELKIQLLLNNPFVHSSVMIRRSALDEVGLYATDHSRQPPEDYELWSRVARRFAVANIPELLHVYREVQGSMSRDVRRPFLDRLVTISAENLAWASETNSLDDQVVNVAALAHGAYHRTRGTPDREAMTEVMRAAITGIDAHDPEGTTRRAGGLIDSLWDRWIDYRFANDWRRYAVRARKLVRRIVRAV